MQRDWVGDAVENSVGEKKTATKQDEAECPTGNKWLKCDTLFTTQSDAVMRNLHDCTQCAQIREQLLSEGSTQPGRWLRDIVPDVLHAIRHAPIFSPVLHPAARDYISSFLLSATQEMNPSNYHSTCTQMTLKHKTDRHADLNIDSPFPISCCSTAFCCTPSPAPPHPPARFALPWKMCSNSRSDCHISFYRSRRRRRKKKEVVKKKQWKWWFLPPQVGACRMQSAPTFHLISFSI